MQYSAERDLFHTTLWGSDNQAVQRRNTLWFVGQSPLILSRDRGSGVFKGGGWERQQLWWLLSGVGLEEGSEWCLLFIVWWARLGLGSCLAHIAGLWAYQVIGFTSWEISAAVMGNLLGSMWIIPIHVTRRCSPDRNSCKWNVFSTWCSKLFLFTQFFMTWPR